jgi:hypothetical protein
MHQTAMNLYNSGELRCKLMILGAEIVQRKIQELDGLIE